MNHKTACQLAILCIEKEIHRKAFLANLHDLGRDDNPKYVAASQRRKDYKEAINILRTIMQTKEE